MFVAAGRRIKARGCFVKVCRVCEGVWSADSAFAAATTCGQADRGACLNRASL